MKRILDLDHSNNIYNQPEIRLDTMCQQVNEIAIYIFAKLPDAQDRNSLGLTCTFFQERLQDLQLLACYNLCAELRCPPQFNAAIKLIAHLENLDLNPKQWLNLTLCKADIFFFANQTIDTHAKAGLAYGADVKFFIESTLNIQDIDEASWEGEDDKSPISINSQQLEAPYYLADDKCQREKAEATYYKILYSITAFTCFPDFQDIEPALNNEFLDMRHLAHLRIIAAQAIIENNPPNISCYQFFLICNSVANCHQALADDRACAINFMAFGYATGFLPLNGQFEALIAGLDSIEKDKRVCDVYRADSSIYKGMLYYNSTKNRDVKKLRSLFQVSSHLSIHAEELSVLYNTLLEKNTAKKLHELEKLAQECEFKHVQLCAKLQSGLLLFQNPQLSKSGLADAASLFESVIASSETSHPFDCISPQFKEIAQRYQIQAQNKIVSKIFK